uniref:Uncharacterized protein n=1 Tax=Candidatus Kentrum sp. MB TaxID=2138164 RepID=A0A450X941_9GAMM|nr:MAG: hypothetical protein BECKMB1821G_GA0114241_101539 [Candidatus Kentron sp. MB]VFK29701.1 MAG: hypothetical protein BECKMB1821I_GA0114274_101138 [Candidatus Kentron sp. MB]VFK74875.1 MAG: hypothetical protein BECKMB1821H_GA0114242_101138 [Candidatus Kentron sp. MB]
MQFDITKTEAKKAEIPHEIFLFNLVGNHILIFIASLGMFESFPYPLYLVPIISVSSLIYILWRAKRSLKVDPWFALCHWQIAARRARVFIGMLSLLGAISLLGWLGYSYLNMMKEAVYAIIGGIGILPTMVTLLVLIMMESDGLYQAHQRKLSGWVLEKFPNSDVPIIEEQ